MVALPRASLPAGHPQWHLLAGSNKWDINNRDPNSIPVNNSTSSSSISLLLSPVVVAVEATLLVPPLHSR
jgi:hypothetical protein